MHMKFQPELKPFCVPTNLYLAKNNIQVSKGNKQTKKTMKESSVEAYFKASWIPYTP